MDLETLRAELERLFELSELIHLSKNVLNFDPDEVGGVASLSSFAGALTRHCAARDAVEALCDAVLVGKPEADPAILQILTQGLEEHEQLAKNDAFGPFTVEKKIGKGRLGSCYLAEKGGERYRLKILGHEATRDKRGLQRFLVLTRLIGTVEHAGLPRGVLTGEVDGRYYVAHQYVQGQPLTARLTEAGPMHFADAKPLLVAILEPLAALHEHRLAHGDLRPENILVHEGPHGAESVTLLDAGSDRLRARARVLNGRTELFSTVASIKTAAPEQIQGFYADCRSDVYAFGALLYEILTDKPLFSEKNSLQMAFGHLTREPDPPSHLAPAHWVGARLDQLVLDLLHKSPDQRPQNAGEVLERLQALEQQRAAQSIAKDELQTRIDAVLDNPALRSAAEHLEAAVDEGADPLLVGEIFERAADQLQEPTQSADSSSEESERVETDSAKTKEDDDTSEEGEDEGERDEDEGEGEGDEGEGDQDEGEDEDEGDQDEGEDEGEGDQDEGEDEGDEDEGEDEGEGDQDEGEDEDERDEDEGEGEPESEGDEDEGKGEGEVDLFDAVPDSDRPSGDSAAEPEGEVAAAAPEQGQPKTERASFDATKLDNDQILELKRDLLRRAARVYELSHEGLSRAEQVYVKLHELAPDETSYVQRLIRCQRRLGKHEEMIELLLALAESSEDRSERSEIMGQIGRLYDKELSDPAQALVAYTHAFCEDPTRADHRRALDRLAQAQKEAWPEVLNSIGEAANNDQLPAKTRCVLYSHAGTWYEKALGRTDLSIACFQAACNLDPNDPIALDGLTAAYRKTGRFQELSHTLLHRAQTEPIPARARDYRSQGAEILEQQLHDGATAQELFEQVIAEDPAHPAASEALPRLYEKSGQYTALVKFLSERVSRVPEQEAVKLECRIAEICLNDLHDHDAATEHYNAALSRQPDNLTALLGLEQVYTSTKQFQRLLENLEAQVELASTPRRKIELLERIAELHENEFLDHAAAAAAWEAILRFDPSHEGALSSLALHYRALDRWQDVAAIYERHLKLSQDSRQRVKLALALGRVLLEQLEQTGQAMRAFEAVLHEEPGHAEALETLAKLRENSGDAQAALKAIDALAEKAVTTEARAEQHLRAARLNEKNGDIDAAIEAYKRALDASPNYPGALAALRAAYIQRGDLNVAVKLFEQEIEATEGERAKAKLAGQLAKFAYEELKDAQRAQAAAKQAFGWDPTELNTLVVLGDIAFENQRFVEASKHYQNLADRADTLPKQTAIRVLMRYADALAQSGSTQEALAPMDTLLRLAPDDPKALERVAQVTFEHGPAKRATYLYKKLLKEFGTTLDPQLHTLSCYRYGEALRRAGSTKEAIAALNEASDLDPSRPEPLIALTRAYEELGDWEKFIRTKSRHLDIADEEERVKILIEMGEVAQSKLKDSARAAKSFVAALEERPDDRRLLTKLMQLYGEEKDWGKLIDIVIRLADFVDDPAQKAKYLQTAARVAAQQLGDPERALDFYEQVLELEPSSIATIDEAIEVTAGKNDYKAVERWLQRKLKAAGPENREVMLESFEVLGKLYETELGLMDKAIDAYEAAQTLDPKNKQRAQKLNELYASDPGTYLDKALENQAALLHDNPRDAGAYRFLRRLYSDMNQTDAAWCVCQAMTVLGLAEAEEERLYRRLRPETAAPAQLALTEEDWLNLVMHPDCDPMLTSIFALIEPAVIAQRGQSPAELGYEEGHRVNPADYGYPIAQNVHYAAGVLGMECPPCYVNTNDPGGLLFLHTHEPSIVLGLAAHAPEVPPQAAAFVAARHLTYMRPGLYLRQLIGTGTGLKSWLFASVKLTAPGFPVAAELQGPTDEAFAALKNSLDSQRKDALTRIAAKLLQSGAALDLKRWVAGVDLTADRAGFIAGYDLKAAADVIGASDPSSATVSAEQRLNELAVYSVSAAYLGLRKKLGISLVA